ncbi:hypothetical protein ADK37_23190 [Streptomyces resistomycificus]|uniref:Phage head morphogenesis domain-containing protein n=1 Tax=Streptomyces resistomycificus TaxID=67356 RepID=A0A0L8L5C6_9ACTN|nr:hypothetical protein ADK37_23190 [Streptomyces resistomycificus]
MLALIQQLWRGMSAATIASDLEGEAGAAIVAAVVAGQLTVAEGAQAFVAGAMAEQGGTAVPEALLVAEAFAGIAPDGGPLETLLFLPAIGVRRRLTAGMTGEQAMIGGLADMARYAATSISDTARSSAQVAMVADRQCVAYTRVVTLPACARCIVLAGQQYSYSEGFLRHPNCDCQTVPLRERDWSGVQSPERLTASMSAAERRRVFGAAGAEAIGQGADIGQVVNARRGMNQAHLHGRDLRVTSEGVTRRGLYGRRMRRAGGGFARVPGQRYARSTTPRLMPEEILRIADDRADQQRLLRRYGYIV